MSAKLLALPLVAALTLCAEPPASPVGDAKASEWRPLFDGESFAGWTGMRGNPLPTKSWAVEDGMLRTLKDGSDGDLRTVEVFNDFELEWEWKIAPKGNSGVKYVVQEDWTNAGFRPDATPERKARLRRSAVGFEYQLSDDERWDRSKTDWRKSATGALYLLHWAEDKPLKPVGEWNTSRIVVVGNHGEHWLNGEKLFEFEMGSKDLLGRVANTKFRAMPGYGRKGPGPIVLQHHGSPAWFRNIRVRTFERQ